MASSSAPDRIRILNAFAAGGTDLTGLPHDPIRTVPETAALHAALEALNARITTDERLWTNPLFSPLDILARQALLLDYQGLKGANSEAPQELWDAMIALADVCQTITESLPAAASGTTYGTESGLTQALACLAGYSHPRLPMILRNVAPFPAFHADYMWEGVFNTAGRVMQSMPDKLTALEDSLRGTLPTSFMLVTYLDFVNTLALEQHWYAGGQRTHPFDTDEGAAKLRELLEEPDPMRFSFAQSAVNALPFLTAERQAALRDLAARHPAGPLTPDAEAQAPEEPETPKKGWLGRLFGP